MRTKLVDPYASWGADVEEIKAEEVAEVEALDDEDKGFRGVRLEPIYESPWSWPFTSAKILVDNAPSGWPFGKCPLCNNVAHGYIDACVLLGKFGSLRVMGFNHEQIVRHLVHHVGPIYRDALAPLLDGLDEEELPPDVEAVYKRVLAAETKLPEDVEECPVYTEGREEGKPGRINVTYAMDGGKKITNMHPWSIERTKQEMEDRKKEAINFYDAMVDIDTKAKTIYNEAVAIGGSKGLSVAVKALHERRGAMTDLAKVGLIAKSVSDKGRVTQLSPELQGMLDTLFAGNPQRLEDLRNVTATAEEDSLTLEATECIDKEEQHDGGEQQDNSGEDDTDDAFGFDDDEDDE